MGYGRVPMREARENPGPINYPGKIPAREARDAEQYNIGTPEPSPREPSPVAMLEGPSLPPPPPPGGAGLRAEEASRLREDRARAGAFLQGQMQEMQNTERQNQSAMATAAMLAAAANQERLHYASQVAPLMPEVPASTPQHHTLPPDTPPAVPAGEADANMDAVLAGKRRLEERRHNPRRGERRQTSLPCWPRWKRSRASKGTGR